jgi:hypothetical protein
MNTVDEKMVGGILIAKESCKKCYGRGYSGYELTEGKKKERTGRVIPCRCLKKVPNKDLIPKGWAEVLMRKKESTIKEIKEE